MEKNYSKSSLTKLIQITAERKKYGAGSQKVKDANFSFMKRNLDHEFSDTAKLLRY